MVVYFTHALPRFKLCTNKTLFYIYNTIVFEVNSIKGYSLGTIGDRLRKLREMMGLSQADAASKYHVLQQNWARYETGTRVPHTFL